MNSTITIQKEVKKLKQHLMPKDTTALAWHNSDGSYGCEGYHFKTRKELQKYVDEQGYSKLIIMSWQT